MTDSSVVMRIGMLLAKEMSMYVVSKWRHVSQRRKDCVVVPSACICEEAFAAVSMMMKRVWFVCCC